MSDTDDTKRVTDDAPTHPTDDKPRYQTPVVIPLGELAKGAGACTGGSLPSDGYCTPGATAIVSCVDGDSADFECGTGLAQDTLGSQPWRV
jgi:hypothetical protein